MEKTLQRNWYALRVFKNRLHIVKKELEDAEYLTYQAMTMVDAFEGGTIKYKKVPLIPSLLFVMCDEKFIKNLKHERFDHLLVYGSPDGKPEPIDEKQMEVFILVTSSPGSGCRVSALSNGFEEYKKGDPVRVIDGFYKGATGVVRRIKKDRKFLVAIEGVAVVAVSDIPFEFLEKIETEN